MNSPKLGKVAHAEHFFAEVLRDRCEVLKAAGLCSLGLPSASERPLYVFLARHLDSLRHRHRICHSAKALGVSSAEWFGGGATRNWAYRVDAFHLGLA